MNFKNTRKVKYGAISYSTILFFIIATVVLNLICSSLSDKINTSIDLTKNHAFAITEDSKNFLSSLKEKVDIIVLSEEDAFAAESDYSKQANIVLKKYAQCCSNISLSYQDPIKNPSLLSSYPSEDIRSASILLKCKNKYKTLSDSDLFDIEQAGYYSGAKIVASKAERALSSAILNITSENKTKMAVLRGYGENVDQGLNDLLEDNNFEVVNVKIATQDIPSDAECAIILGCTRDYDEIGIEKLKKFMENGGQHGKNLFVAPSAENKSYNNLNLFLKDYGLEISSGIVIETDLDSVLDQSYVFFFSSYEDTTLLKNFKGSDIKVATPLSLPINVLDKDNVKILLSTSTKSGIVPHDADSSWHMTEDKLTGPITIGAAYAKDNTKVFVFGSSTAFASNILKRSSLNNCSYFTSLFKSMDKDAVDLNIQPVSFESETVDLTSNQKGFLVLCFAVILPSTMVVLAILITVIRKNKSFKILKGRSAH